MDLKKEKFHFKIRNSDTGNMETMEFKNINNKPKSIKNIPKDKKEDRGNIG